MWVIADYKSEAPMERGQYYVYIDIFMYILIGRKFGVGNDTNFSESLV